MTFPDFEAYCQTKEQMLADYEDSLSWSSRMLTNIARASYFSSDRTIREYNNDIWHLTEDASPVSEDSGKRSTDPEPRESDPHTGYTSSGTLQ